MKLWVDAQLSPHLAAWIEAEFQIESWSVKSLNLRDAADSEVFTAARQAKATVITKDSDFVELLYRHGTPPKIKGDWRPVGEGIRELRIPEGKGYRVYYAWDGDALVLFLCGGNKAKQSSDIVKAKEFWRDYHGQ